MWEAAHVPPAALASTFEALSSSLDVAKLFMDAMGTGEEEEEEQMKKGYSLRAMACYASSHYYALVFSDEVDQWVLINDADISSVGGWQEVGNLISAKRLQPSLLFYEASK